MIGWLNRKGLPAWLSLLVTILVMILVLVGMIVIVGFSIGELVASLPKYADNLQGQQKSLQTFLDGFGTDTSSIQNMDTHKLLGYVGTLLGGVVGLLSGVVMMLMVLIFLLIATPGLTTKFKIDFDEGSPTFGRFRSLAVDLREYVGITTLINLGVGVIDAIFLFILGIDFPILWGVMAFFMGYIPSVGFWMALLPPFALAFMEFGATKALIVLVGYILINGGIQNILQPKMMGSGLNLAPIVVVVSIFFWTWVLGPMGALLSIPLTMVVKEIFLEAYDDTRALVVLMDAGNPPPEPA
jgi:predicted PurR-regulated permease PerM